MKRTDFRLQYEKETKLVWCENAIPTISYARWLEDKLMAVKENCNLDFVSGSLCVGDYVLVNKYADKDPYDPWGVGFIDEICIDKSGTFVRIYELGMRRWKHAKKITKEQGEDILRDWENYR